MHSASGRRTENQHTTDPNCDDENQGTESETGRAIFSLNKYFAQPKKASGYSYTIESGIPRYSLAAPLKWKNNDCVDFDLISDGKKHMEHTLIQNYTQLIIWCISSRIASLQTRFRGNDASSSMGISIMTIKKLRSKLQQLSIEITLQGTLNHPPRDLHELLNLKVCLDGANAHIKPQIIQIHEYMKVLRHQKLQPIIIMNNEDQSCLDPRKKLNKTENDYTSDVTLIKALYDACVKHLAKIIYSIENEIAECSGLLRTMNTAKVLSE